MVDQTGWAGIAGELDEAVDELAGQLGGTQTFQVHGQDGGVVDAVDRPEVVVELEAVEDAGAVAQAEDVLGEQIAVSVTDVAIG